MTILSKFRFDSNFTERHDRSRQAVNWRYDKTARRHRCEIKTFYDGCNFPVYVQFM